MRGRITMFRIIKNDGKCREELKNCKYVLHAYDYKGRDAYAKINLKAIVGYFINKRKRILK